MSVSKDGSWTLTASDIRRLLVAHGIKPRSRSWPQYERAKRLLQNIEMTSKEYEECTLVITKYLDL